jgi:hypothetical protein
MNFKGSRLGFWFKYPLGLPDRGVFTKKVLVFYDPYTYVDDGEGTIVNNWYDIDVNPSTDVWPLLQEREIAAGFEPELIVGYDNLPADMTQYAHIWDIGYASPYIDNPTLDPTNLLTAYLQAGGAMFMLGENASLNQGAGDNRDYTISTFLQQCGSGSVVESNIDYNYALNATVEPEFLIANNNNLITYLRPGTFTSIGTGTPMSTEYAAGAYVAVMWKTGSLSNATRGAVISVLDINFITIVGPQVDFIDNLIASLNQR